jgi:hypothetical protein
MLRSVKAKAGAPMTERQRENQLLSELLDLPETANETHITNGSAQPSILTQHEEQALLRAANAVGTPTLAPEGFEPAQAGTPGSFVTDLAGVVRKHPMLAVLAVGGAALVLARRRRR